MFSDRKTLVSFSRHTVINNQTNLGDILFISYVFIRAMPHSVDSAIAFILESGDYLLVHLTCKCQVLQANVATGKTNALKTLSWSVHLALSISFPFYPKLSDPKPIYVRSPYYYHRLGLRLLKSRPTLRQNLNLEDWETN